MTLRGEGKWRRLLEILLLSWMLLRAFAESIFFSPEWVDVVRPSFALWNNDFLDQRIFLTFFINFSTTLPYSSFSTSFTSRFSSLPPFFPPALPPSSLALRTSARRDEFRFEPSRIHARAGAQIYPCVSRLQHRFLQEKWVVVVGSDG